MNRFLPLVLTVGLLSGCVYFNTVYNAKTAYDSGVESYREHERQGREISNQTKDQFRRAVEKGKKILSEYPDSKYVDDAYLLIGKSYYYLDQAGLSRNYLSDLISNYPNSPYREEARLFLGRAYFQLEEHALARHAFEYLIRNSKNNALRAQAYMALADLEKANGNSAAMLDNVNAAIEIAEDNEVKADAAWRTGQWAMDHKQYSEAEQYFQQAARFTHKPQFDRQIEVQMVRVNRQQGRFDIANENIQAMLADEEFEDQYDQLEIQRGLIYAARDDTSKAADTYRYVVSEYPKTDAGAAAHFLLGELAYKRMDYSLAKSHYDKVRSASSNSEYVDEAQSQSDIIADLQNFRSKQQTIQQKIIEAYTATQMPADTMQQDSLAAAPDSTQTEGAAEKSDKQKLMDSFLGQNEADEDSAAAEEAEFSFEEAYSWLMEQDSSQLREDYARTLYNLSELFILDINKFDYGLALSDSVLALAVDNELVAQTKLLQAHTFTTFLENPSKGKSLIAEVRQKYPNSKALRLYDTKDQLAVRNQEEKKQPTQEFIILAQRYDRADSLLLKNKYDDARQIFSDIYQGNPQSEFGPKSLYALGWMYENKLFNLDSAMSKYATFQNRYPEHKMYQSVSERLRKLRDIKTALTAKTEEPDTSAAEPQAEVSEPALETTASDTTRQPVEQPNENPEIQRESEFPEP